MKHAMKSASYTLLAIEPVLVYFYVGCEFRPPAMRLREMQRI